MASFFHPDITLKPHEHRLNTALLRSVANMATFHALCQQMNGGCFRAQRCRGDAGECVGRFVNLLPEDAWDWIEAVLEGQRDRVPFDELVEKHPEGFEAIVEWRDALARTSGRTT
jgi:hypothetical protein